ncbi:Cytochrome P450 [Penicillium malachiteum]|nr:Cytochrome P450 [Penicillium malachiteum]
MPKSFWTQVLALLEQNPPPAQHSAIPRPKTNLMALSMFPEYIYYPHRHLAETASAYAVLQSDNHRMRDFLNHELLRSLPEFHQSRYRAAFTVVSALALLLNTLLRSCDPIDTILLEESKYFHRYIIDGAELAYPDRPFGATHVHFCLVIALAACEDHPQDMARIEALLLDYQADFKAKGWMNCAAWLRRLFENHRLYGGFVPMDLDIDISDLGVPGCCALM